MASNKNRKANDEAMMMMARRIRPAALGTINGTASCEWSYQGRTFTGFDTPLGAALASVELEAPIGAIITMKSAIFGVRRYRIIPNVGGDRTPDKRFAEWVR